jgi:TfoX/Sxy family transcriptional regulator of competence genes
VKISKFSSFLNTNVDYTFALKKQMAYNEQLAERIREIVSETDGVTEKKMFGGVAFILREKMFAGVVKDDLMIRCLAERYDELLEKPGCRPMDFTGKPMRGFLFVALEDLKTTKQLKYWLDIGTEFVFHAPEKSKKKK